MEVCHVCGAFLVMNDTSNRLDAHLQGKQHTGYQKIHETYEELKVRKTPWTTFFLIGGDSLGSICSASVTHFPNSNLWSKIL